VDKTTRATSKVGTNCSPAQHELELTSSPLLLPPPRARARAHRTRWPQEWLRAYNKQDQKHSIFVLGLWDTWEVRDGRSQMLYANGDKCGATPRASRVELKCGMPAFNLLSASEPSTCVYELVLETPLDCAQMERDLERYAPQHQPGSEGGAVDALGGAAAAGGGAAAAAAAAAAA
jgi:hypothetical protein